MYQNREGFDQIANIPQKVWVGQGSMENLHHHTVGLNKQYQGHTRLAGIALIIHIAQALVSTGQSKATAENQV